MTGRQRLRNRLTQVRHERMVMNLDALALASDMGRGPASRATRPARPNITNRSPERGCWRSAGPEILRTAISLLSNVLNHVLQMHCKDVTV